MEPRVINAIVWYSVGLLIAVLGFFNNIWLIVGYVMAGIISLILNFTEG